MESPQPLYGTAQLRQIDAQAIGAAGSDDGSGYWLMTRAAAAALALLRWRWPQARRLGIACGPGNNGGDGLVLARLAAVEGFAVQVLALPGTGQPSVELRRATDDWQAAGGDIREFAGQLPDVDLWVDALFGIGLKRAPTDTTLHLIEAINAAGRPILALDVPSGLDADSGHAPGACVRADVTLSFIAGKRGLHTGAARDLAGEVLVGDLQIDASAFDGVTPTALRLSAAQLAGVLPRRLRDTHKGSHGHVLCLGGDHGYAGAVRLCAEAALRTGAGLVSVATRADSLVPLLAGRPEVMGRAVTDMAQLRPLLAAGDVLALGPGLGQGEWGRMLFAGALASEKPLVVDADALNLLAAAPQSLPQAILTPHPGEAARLLACSSAQIQRDRYAAISALVERFQCVVVLKGAGTLVAAPGETIRVIDAGNPGMATGGMGDVLTGVIAALLAQGLTRFAAASHGALLHAVAGDAAASEGGERGLLPSDLFGPLRQLVNRP